MAVLDKEDVMEFEMSTADLSEMLGICYMYKEMGHDKVQMNTEHAVEILQRLITYEEKQ
jgi:hypothetical protein